MCNYFFLDLGDGFIDLRPDLDSDENKICSPAQPDWVNVDMEEVKKQCLNDMDCKGFYFHLQTKDTEPTFWKCMEGYNLINKTSEQQSMLHLKGML